MPESVNDRCTKSHEHIFLLTKSARYYFDADAIKEDAVDAGRVKKATGPSSKNAGKGKFGATAIGFTKHDMVVTDRNKRSVWTIATQPYSEAHFATFPQELPEICIKAGSRIGDTILDPFGGAGTTGLVADKLGRNAVLIELNPEYAAMAEKRIFTSAPLFAEVVNSNSEQMTLLESDP
jgi:DNA modification methylase